MIHSVSHIVRFIFTFESRI